MHTDMRERRDAFFSSSTQYVWFRNMCNTRSSAPWSTNLLYPIPSTHDQLETPSRLPVYYRRSIRQSLLDIQRIPSPAGDGGHSRRVSVEIRALHRSALAMYNSRMSTVDRFSCISGYVFSYPELLIHEISSRDKRRHAQRCCFTHVASQRLHQVNHQKGPM